MLLYINDVQKRFVSQHVQLAQDSTMLASQGQNTFRQGPSGGLTH